MSQLEPMEAKPAGDLEMLRSNISKMPSQRAVLVPRISGVWSPPIELWSYIFELGASDQQAEPKESKEQAKGEEERGHEEAVSCKNVNFQALVSQVCRMFREVAIHTPGLWTRIHVRDLARRRLDFVQMCVERSGASPLDILLDTMHQYPPSEYGGLSSFMAIIMPHISRFQRLTVRLPGFCSMYDLMKALDRPAPLLEALELRVVEDLIGFEENDPSSPPDLRGQLTLFGGALPKLRSVALDGAYVDWRTCGFANLVQLRLRLSVLMQMRLGHGNFSRDVRPSWDEFAALARASPALEVLEIIGATPRMPDPPAAAHCTPVLLEQLTELKLTCLVPAHATALVALLRAPRLRSLALMHMDMTDNTALARRIAGPPALFPALATLKLDGLSVADDAACGALLRACPALTHLALYMGRMTTAWLEVLGGAGGVGAVVCPRLECLRCVYTFSVDVRRVLESRRDAGCHVPRLELDQGTTMRAADMQWFRENGGVEIIKPYGR